jgi:hypothetical protein
MVIDRALNGYTPGGTYRWDAYLNSTQMGGSVKNWTDFAHEDVRGAEAEKARPGARARKSAEPAAESKPKRSAARNAPPPELGEGGVPETRDMPSDGGPSIPHPVPDAETTP